MLSDKGNKKYVVVDTIKTFRYRYCVELEGNSPEEWAFDTVTCGEALEVDRVYLAETITNSHTFNSKEEVDAYFSEKEETAL